MGTSWKQAGKQANASKRGAIVSKLAKEIAIAAKMGDANPANNPRLRAAVESARKQSVTRDVIERAIKKGAGLLEGISYELVTYEGFTPHKVPVIVECMTDNKNRTAADVRVLFRKGQLGAAGAVGWMFDRMGVVEATHSDRSLDIEGVAIECGAQNVEKLEDQKDEDGKPLIAARFFTEMTDLDAVGKALADAGWSSSVIEMRYIPKNYVEDLSDEQTKEVSDFLEALDDHDDVHRIYPAIR
jgi:YebC/PmpR family DNA-binding regulatory protein